jgi:hypothetical protein
MQPIVADGVRIASPKAGAATSAIHGRTGAMIRDARFRSWCTAFVAVTTFSGKSIVSGSPVFGFGS